MSKFNFKARNTAGALVQGSRNAASERELVALLKNEGLIVFSIQAGSEDSGSAAEAKGKKIISGLSKARGGSVGYQDIAIFCRQLATLINAGVNILDAVDDIADMVTSPRFRTILKGIASDVREGSTLSDAMKKHQKVFGKVFVSMIAAGEKSGKIGKVLQDMALYLENSVKLRRKVKAASVYPIFVASFFLVTLSALVLFIIPRFASMFASFGADLPLPTKIVMGISTAVLHNIIWIILAVAGIVTGVVTSGRTPRGKLLFDNLTLKIPVFGELFAKVIYARFFQTLGTLLRSGVDIIASIEIASRVTNSLPFEQRLEIIKQRILEGASFSSEMEKTGFFPKMAVRMIAVGEKSGQMDEMLDKLSDYYSDEVDGAVAIMSSIIEPLLIILLGLMVGVVVVTMYLPIFKLASAMSGG